MSEVFGQVYAGAYDTLYQETDYDAECSLICQVFSGPGFGRISTVLDLGCGTGNHAIRLAAQGFDVTGVDCSDAMLEIGRKKAADRHLPATFLSGDIRALSLGRVFDAAIMMGAVFGYQVSNSGVLETLLSVRRHLNTGGPLILEFWYGPAVISQQPGDRVRILEKGGVTTLRTSRGMLDTRHHTVEVQFHVWQFEGDRIRASTREQHTMRYFFPMELELFFSQSGFELVKLGAFPEFGKVPDETSWHAMAVARAV